MKKIITLLLLFISINSFAQIKAAIFKNNGDVLKGFASISNHNSNLIKYRKNIGDKPQKFGPKDIDKVYFILVNKSYIEYQFKTISKKNIQLMKVLIRGKLSLYSFTETVDYITHSSGRGFGNVNIGKSHTSTHFYVSKKKNSIVDEFPKKSTFKSFKKNASAYFKDCAKLVKKIKKREFKKSDVIEIVEFYNKECNQKETK
jgi:hypothetical protein